MEYIRKSHLGSPDEFASYMQAVVSPLLIPPKPRILPSYFY